MIFDSLYPDEIVVGNHVHITMGTIILTHCLDTRHPFGVKWNKGHVEIGDHTFIGARTIICNNVKIGRNCIVGAGSIVTRNIPDNEIWAGNPARLVKKREVSAVSK